MTYDVVLLVEQALTADDATRVRSLHEGIEEPVAYHVLLPAEDAAARVEAAMGTIGGGELLGNPGVLAGVDIDAIEKDAKDRANRAMTATCSALTAAGATVDGAVVVGDPVDALKKKIDEVDGREAIILTRSHVIAEFFHVDWTAQARRALGVPVLHLVEHENFDEQSGEGEGASLI